MTAQTWLLYATFFIFSLFSSKVRAQEKTNAAEIPKPSSGVHVSPQNNDRFSLKLGARIQSRYVFTTQAGESAHKFQIRRARLKLKGHVFGKNNRFYIQLGLSPEDMTGGLLSETGSPRRVPLRDARIEFHQLAWAQIWIGQMKVPFSHERIVSDAYLNLVDRSLHNQEFNMDRDLGVQVRSDHLGGFFSYALGAFSGQGRNIYDETKPALTLVGRLQFRLVGHADLATQGDLQRSPRPGASLGIAYSLQSAAPGDQGVHGHRPADGGTTSMEQATSDLVFKWRGLALEAAASLRLGRRRVDNSPRLTQIEAVRNGWGYLVQLGYLLQRTRLELVARYSQLKPLYLGGLPSALDPASEVNGGINYYLGGHDLKIEFDLSHRWERRPLQSDTLKINALRLQFQLAI